MKPTVAALFVETDGIYFGLDGVDPWDAERDARLYAGPHPVVAHPPCHLWVNFAALNFKRYGGEHNRPGNDLGCFSSALASVRRWGGVLEHPASSNAWPAHGLLRPPCEGWVQSGRVDERGWGEWSCEVWQSAYGHPARKRTWLYYVGPEEPSGLNWEHNPGTHQIGWFDRIKPTVSKSEASRTPLAFRDALLDLARNSGGRGGIVSERCRCDPPPLIVHLTCPPRCPRCKGVIGDDRPKTPLPIMVGEHSSTSEETTRETNES